MTKEEHKTTDIIKQRPLRRRQNKKTSDNHPRMLVSLTYTHAQDSLGNVITRTTIVILQQRGKSSLLDLVSSHDRSLYKNCQYGKDRYSTVDCPPPPRNLRIRCRRFFRIIIGVQRISLNSEKSPQKSSFLCKVYKYCHNFPVCKTICYTVCKTICYTVCKTICYTVCKTICYTVCKTICYTVCKTICYTVCKTVCNTVCKTICNTVCKTVCNTVCKTVCKTVCNTVCNTVCKTASGPSPVQIGESLINSISLPLFW